MLRRNTYCRIAHGCAGHIVNVVLASLSQVGSFDNGQQFIVGDASTSLTFEPLNGSIAELCSLAQELDLIVALDEPELLHLRCKVHECSLRECALDRCILLKGDRADHTDTTLRQPALPQVFYCGIRGS